MTATMRIDLKGNLFWFGERAVRFDRYMSSNDVLTLLEVWLRRLGEVVAVPFYLPFSVNEGFIEAFEVTSVDLALTLRVVTFDGIGFVPGVDSLEEHIVQTHRVIERRPMEFLRCPRDEFYRGVVATHAELMRRIIGVGG